MAEESKSQRDDGGQNDPEPDAADLIERLVQLLASVDAEDPAGPSHDATSKIDLLHVENLDHLDEIAAFLSKDAKAGDHPRSVYRIEASGEPPTEKDARKRVETWLKVRNPVFGNESPESFLKGTKNQKRYFASIVRSIEGDLFS